MHIAVATITIEKLTDAFRSRVAMAVPERITPCGRRTLGAVFQIFYIGSQMLECVRDPEHPSGLLDRSGTAHAVLPE
jgi:hypothetical protein